MANKNSRQEPESNPSGADHGDLNQGPPPDETIRIDNDDSTSEASDCDAPKEDLMETTIEGLADSREGVPDAGESTIIPDPDATLIPEDDSGDPEATVANLETTARVDSRGADEADAAGDPNKTVAASQADQTVAIDSSSASQSRPTVRGGTVQEKTVAGSLSDTTINVGDEDRVRDRTVAVRGGSVLTKANIGETINPRELSEQDATLWNSALGEQASDPSVLPPAIDRTFSDKQFDRLRQCDVSPLKSDPDKASDYRLVRKLGQGGMGDVFVARQGSLDRLLALKLIKPLTGKKKAQLQRTGKLQSVEEERRQQFLSEAIVTGDLDHPNIVPIHDVALTSTGELFYAMKRVVGTPWSDVIKEKSRDENVEILLKAADAIGFAHTRGVVHRDIKPENIMLGDFGVVMVMDWGLALPTSGYEKQDSIFSTSGLGGTPAFMAPEMATGPLDRIGPASDIYLLGATLFMIVTGKAPHHAKNVTECLKAVRTNAIRNVAEEKQGELLDVAIRAMATRPADRYSDVESFQTAIREYRSHAESISLAVRAADDLEVGKKERSYADFSRAAFRFEEAIKFWDGNEKAHLGLAETKFAHAEAACENGDFDLGLSLLDKDLPEHGPLRRQLREGLHERESRVARLSLMRKVAVAMLAFIIVGGSVAMYLIDAKRREAEFAQAAATKARDAANVARDDATEARDEATFALIAEQKAKLEAEAAAESEKQAKEAALASENRAKEALTKEALAKQEALEAADAERLAKLKEVEARDKADQAKEEALAAKEQAESSRKRAEYEEYVSKIGLAKARLERNEADGAREILQQLKDSPQSSHRASGWEWRWLWRQANQSESSEKVDAAVIDLSMAPSGRQAIVALSSGKVDWLDLSEDGRLTARRPVPDSFLGGAVATAVAVSPDERSVAIGTQSGDILVQTTSMQKTRRLRGHQRAISDLQFSADGLLVSGSADKTVRLWDTQSGVDLTQQNACWHISPVRQIAVAGDSAVMLLAVAISDEVTGQVAIWTIRREDDRVSVKRRGTLTDHRQPVSAVAISTDGNFVASGDVAGNVLVWNPATIPSIDYAGSIKDALASFEGNREATEARPKASRSKGSKKSVAARLVDSSWESERFVSTTTTDSGQPRAHDDVVQSIRFSSDGKSLVTSSDDYTLKVWDLADRSISKTLKGHGGWVIGAEFLRGTDDVIISASSDSTVRSWRPGKYVGAFVVQKSGDDAFPTARGQTQAHADEIWSASFSPDGTKVVTASQDHTARVMEIDEQTLAFKEVARLDDEVLGEGTSFVAMSMQVDRPHKRLYVGSADATIRVWDLQLGTEIGEAGGTGLNTAFAISKDGQLMLTGSSSPDAKAILWRLDPTGASSPRIIHRLKEHSQAVTAFAISPDSKRLFTGDRAGYGILWDASTGQRVGVPVENVRGFRINAAGFSASSGELLIASDDEQLTVIDLQSRRIVRRMNHDGYVTQLSLSSDGRRALTVSELSTQTQFRSVATLWDLPSGKDYVLDQVIDQRGESEDSSSSSRNRITSAHLDGSGETVVVSHAAVGQQPSTVQVWNVAKLLAKDVDPEADQTLKLPAILGSAEAVIPLEGRSLLTMNKNAAFRWDLATKRLSKSYRAHAALTEACFSFDGKYVATGSRSVKIWDAITGETLGKLESSRPLRTVQFAPKPMGPTKYVIASGGDEGVMRLWKWDPKAREITSFDRPKAAQDKRDEQLAIIRRVRFSPDGDRLFTVGDGGLARVVNLKEPWSSISLDASNAGDFICAAFSEDGKCVAAGSTDKRIRVWQLPAPGEPPRGPILLDGHADRVNDVALFGETEANLRVMTASSDDTARIWDPRLEARDDQGHHQGGREIISLRRHTGDVTAVDITEDGDLLMTAGRDGAVILWPAEPVNLFDSVELDAQEE